MKHLKHLFTALLLLFSVAVNAHDFEVGGIYYNITDESNKTVAVTYKGNSYSAYSNEYTGDVVIPESVAYSGNTYSVTSIGSQAFRDCSGLTSVVIPNSVTSIGSNAFDSCYGLTSIEIPNSVTSIGNVAFWGCSRLTSIEIPNSVTSIGNEAFDGCSSLTSVVIPNSVTSIGFEAFYNCSGLTSIVIPNSVTSIGKNAFDGTAWYNNQPGGVVYAGKVLYKYKGTMPENTSIIIEEGTLGITDNAFQYCSVLTSVVIPNSVTSIGNYAFSACYGLTSVEIPNSVTSIGNYAFYGCTGLKTIINLSNLTFSKGSSNSGYVAYYANKVINAPNGFVDGDFVWFENENGMTLAGYFGDAAELTIPTEYNGNSVTSIGDYAFYNCSGLTGVEIPNSVTSIGNYAFNGCASLNDLRIEDGEGTLSLGYNFYNSSDTGKGLFYDCPLEKLYLGRNLSYSTSSSYGYSPFYNKTTLTSVTIGGGVTNIDNNAFKGCSYIKDLFFEKGNSILTLANNVFYDSPLETLFLGRDLSYDYGCSPSYNKSTLRSVTIGDSVTSIGDYAFYECDSLASIAIPNNVINISDNAFQGCDGLKKVVLNTTTVGNWFRGNTSIKEVVTGSCVTSIADGAFSGCSNLASVTVGSKVVYIGFGAFSGCTGIAKMFWMGNTPPVGYESLSGKINYVANNQYSELNGEVVVSQFLSSKFEIGGTVFIPTSLADKTCCVVDYNVLSDVVDVVIEEMVSYQGVSLKVQNINSYSFFGKVDVESLTFMHNGGIGKSAFEGCDSLEIVEIPHSVTFVGDNAFRNCKNLVDVKIADRETVLPLGMQLFVSTSLETLYLGGKISYDESVGAMSPFSHNQTLKSVVITNAESNIYDYEFYNCTALESAVIGDGVEKIGRWAFSGCINLSEFVFSSNLDEIADEAFSDCTGLARITGRAVLPPICGAQALDDINKWNCKLYVPSVNLEAYRNAEQWREFLFVEELVSTDNYVTYKIDGEVYKTLLIKPGERIVAPVVEEKAGYVFSGWNMDDYISDCGYPVMPNEDIVFEGTFNAHKFVVTYFVDGEIYVTDSVACGSEIVPVAEPTKDGHSFSGWSELPETMPANDVAVYGSFIADSYYLTSIVDGEVETYNLGAEKHVDDFAYYRTLPDVQWNSLYVPFDIKVEDLANDYDIAYINCVHSYDHNKNGEIDEMEMEVILVLDGVLKANYPYLIRAKDEYVLDIALCLENTTLYAAEENGVTCSSVFTRFDVVGNYTTQPVQETAGCYEVRDGMWQVLNPGAELLPFRHYLYITNIDGSPLKENVVRSMSIRVDGEVEDDDETTGIDELQSADNKGSYDLQGRKINEITEKGIYIVNGKKVLVK